MFNKVIIAGHLTRDIEFNTLANGTSAAKSAIATTHTFKNNMGETKEETCFLDFSIFGRMAEVARDYTQKGSKVLLDGRLVFEQWTSSDGSKRSKHSLRVETLQLLDRKGDSVREVKTVTSPKKETKIHDTPSDRGLSNDVIDDLDDIPF